MVLISEWMINGMQPANQWYLHNCIFVFLLQNLTNIGDITKTAIVVPSDYPEHVNQAKFVFKHQIVYDFSMDILVPCTPYCDVIPDYKDIAGEYPFYVQWANMSQNVNKLPYYPY